RLLFHMLSTQGPGVAKGDVNADGLDDVYVGGAKGQEGSLLMQQANGSFKKIEIPAFATDSLSEDIDALFFDADNDKDLDLYVVSGGTEFTNQAAELKNRLYINQSSGNAIKFLKSTGLPDVFQSGSCVTASDIDHDGDMDIFLGIRVIPGYYGDAPAQYIFVNDGKGTFTDATTQWNSSFLNLGMVSDAAWFDLDQDGWDDLIIVGEWMPVTIFKNDGKKLTKVELKGTSMEKTDGWWNTLSIKDLNNDGRPDVVLGNLGLNSRFRPTKENPVSLYVSDFDGNGSIDPIYTYKKDGKIYPYALRQDLLKQIPSLKKKFLFYKDYAGKGIEQLFSPEQLAKGKVLNFYNASSSTLINLGNFNFLLKPLPVEAQVSPIYAIESEDVNGDGNIDLIVAGNFISVKPEIGRYDDMQGLVLLGDGKGEFKALPSATSGLKIDGEVKKILSIRSKAGQRILFARNNQSLKLYGISKQP
ncbi:MAG: VCBS repeat-containing protein, partial [Chitinophagales bacterium]